MNLLKNISNINIPFFYNIKIIKNLNKNKIQLIFFNKNNFITIYINEMNKTHVNYNLNSLKIISNFFYNKNILNRNNFLKILKSWNHFFFIKIKFKGKGYKIRYHKKRKLMRFFFNTSHITMFKFGKLRIRKKGKYKFLIKTKKFNKIKQIAFKIIKIRFINIYTSRGLRLSKQIIFKRKGKKSSYI